MNTLKIQIPEGFQVDTFDKKTGEVKLMPIPRPVCERLKSMADVFAYHNTTEEDFLSTCSGLTNDEVGYRLEKLIVAAYNEGKVPDFDDNTPKFYPLFDFSGGGFRFSCAGSWRTDSYVGARLLFVGPEARANLLDAVEKFLPQYKLSRTF